VRDDGLTDDEGLVMDALIDAVEAFDALPSQHPQETTEFYSALHRLQDLLACRICRRDYPEAWVNWDQDAG
jgi:hypothetical protein